MPTIKIIKIDKIKPHFFYYFGSSISFQNVHRLEFIIYHENIKLFWSLGPL